MMKEANNFRTFLSKNRFKYPFLSQEQIIFKLRQQWRKLNGCTKLSVSTSRPSASLDKSLSSSRKQKKENFQSQSEIGVKPDNFNFNEGFEDSMFQDHDHEIDSPYSRIQDDLIALNNLSKQSGAKRKSVRPVSNLSLQKCQQTASHYTNRKEKSEAAETSHSFEFDEDDFSKEQLHVESNLKTSFRDKRKICSRRTKLRTENVRNGLDLNPPMKIDKHAKVQNTKINGLTSRQTPKRKSVKDVFSHSQRNLRLTPAREKRISFKDKVNGCSKNTASRFSRKEKLSCKYNGEGFIEPANTHNGRTRTEKVNKEFAQHFASDSAASAKNENSQREKQKEKYFHTQREEAREEQPEEEGPLDHCICSDEEDGVLLVRLDPIADDGEDKMSEAEASYVQAVDRAKPKLLDKSDNIQQKRAIKREQGTEKENKVFECRNYLKPHREERVESVKPECKKSSFKVPTQRRIVRTTPNNRGGANSKLYDRKTPKDSHTPVVRKSPRLLRTTCRSNERFKDFITEQSRKRPSALSKSNNEIYTDIEKSKRKSTVTVTPSKSNSKDPSQKIEADKNPNESSCNTGAANEISKSLTHRGRLENNASRKSHSSFDESLNHRKGTTRNSEKEVARNPNKVLSQRTPQTKSPISPKHEENDEHSISRRVASETDKHIQHTNRKLRQTRNLNEVDSIAEVKSSSSDKNTTHLINSEQCYQKSTSDSNKEEIISNDTREGLSNDCNKRSGPNYLRNATKKLNSDANIELHGDMNDSDSDPGSDVDDDNFVGLGEEEEEDENCGMFCTQVATETNAALLHALMKLKARGSSPEVDLPGSDDGQSSPGASSVWSQISEKSIFPKNMQQLQEDDQSISTSRETQQQAPPNVTVQESYFKKPVGTMFKDVKHEEVATGFNTPGKRRLISSAGEATPSNFGSMFDTGGIFF